MVRRYEAYLHFFSGELMYHYIAVIDTGQYRMKMIGKPYSGKLNVLFDEEELGLGSWPLRQLSTLPFGQP